MKRSGFQRKPYVRPPTRKLTPVDASHARQKACSAVCEPIGKGKVVTSPALRNAARGEDCTLKIVGHCNGNSETSVMAHMPSPIKGYKSTDLGSICVSCSDCHDVLDNRTKHEVSDSDMQFYMRRATILTLALLHDKQLILVK